MSIVGPRPTIPVQVEQYTERQRGRLAVRPGITGWAQVNGRASLPWAERIELDLWYVEHRIAAARPADPRPHGRDPRARRGPLQGGDRRMASRRIAGRPPDGRRQALRHRGAFAQHATVVAADPNPLAPAQYAAPTRVAPFRASTTPGTSRRCRRCATSSRVGAVVPLTDLDIEVLARGPRRGSPPRVRPRSRDRGRDLRQVRDPPAARAPRPALSADRAARASRSPRIR